MKSKDHKTAASRFVTFVGLSFALALGFFVVNQGTYTSKATGAKVLGVSASPISTVTRTLDGAKYACQRVNCDSVVRSGFFADNDDDDVCRSVSDSAGRNACNWTEPGLPGINTPQCDVNKTHYRTSNTTYGTLNLALVKQANEDSENIAYYNCKKIVPTKAPTPTPVKTCTIVGNKCCSLYIGGNVGTSYFCKNNLKCSDQWGGGTCIKRVVTPTPTRKLTPTVTPKKNPTDPKPTAPKPTVTGTVKTPTPTKRPTDPKPTTAPARLPDAR